MMNHYPDEGATPEAGKAPETQPARALSDRSPTTQYMRSEYTKTEKTSIYYNIGIGWVCGALFFAVVFKVFHTC